MYPCRMTRGVSCLVGSTSVPVTRRLCMLRSSLSAGGVFFFLLSFNDDDDDGDESGGSTTSDGMRVSWVVMVKELGSRSPNFLANSISLASAFCSLSMLLSSPLLPKNIFGYYYIWN